MNPAEQEDFEMSNAQFNAILRMLAKAIEQAHSIEEAKEIILSFITKE